MPAAKTSQKSKSSKRSTSKGSSKGSAVTRNVVAARDKIADSISGSLNVILLTRKNIEEVIDDAVSRGRMTRNDAQEMLNSLLQRGARATGDALSDLERLIGRTGEKIEDTSGEPGLPIEGYDDLSAAQVQERLARLTPAQLRKVRDYERRHANRKTVLDPVERKLR